MTRRCKLLFSAAAALALAGPAQADVSACTIVKIAELPIRVIGNKLIADATINGQKAGVLIDTGAMMTLILRPATDRLGLQRQEARGYRIFGMGGETKAESVLIDDFRLGQASRKGWRMLVAGEHEIAEGAAVLLGEDFFSQVDVEFDLAHNAVRLFQPKNCEGVTLSYWTTEEPSEVAIDPVYDYQPQIFLTVHVNGQPVKAMLDSGAGGSVLTRSDAARSGVTPETAGVVAVPSGTGLGPKKVDMWIGLFDTVVIGNESIKHAHIHFGDLYREFAYRSIGSRLLQSAEKEQPMLLGADFLRAHRVLVSHSQRKMYFTYLGGPVFAPPPQLTQHPQPPQSGAEPRADKDASPKRSEK